MRVISIHCKKLAGQRRSLSFTGNQFVLGCYSISPISLSALCLFSSPLLSRDASLSLPYTKPETKTKPKTLAVNKFLPSQVQNMKFF